MIRSVDFDIHLTVLKGIVYILFWFWVGYFFLSDENLLALQALIRQIIPVITGIDGGTGLRAIMPHERLVFDTCVFYLKFSTASDSLTLEILPLDCDQTPATFKCPDKYWWLLLMFRWNKILIFMKALLIFYLKVSVGLCEYCFKNINYR